MYDRSIEKTYDGIEDYIIKPDFKINGLKGIDSFEHMGRWIFRDIDADFYIYSAQFPAYHAIVDNTPYLYYCHTPHRILYDLRGFIFKHYNNTVSLKILGRLKISSLYLADQYLHRCIINSRQVVTNSNLVYNRYFNAYNRKPRCVVNPPIDTRKFYNKSSEDFYLTVGRLELNKRVDMIIRAFAKTNENLIIVGDGPDRDRLVDIADKCHINVEFRSSISETQLSDLYSRCKAFIFSAMNEDFGLTPIEALASSKPIISINEGGPLEYLNERNSFLFNDINGLRNIILTHSIDDYESMKNECLNTAKRFDIKEIGIKLLSIIKEINNENYSRKL